MPTCYPYDSKSDPVNEASHNIIMLDIDLLLRKKSLQEIREIAEKHTICIIIGGTRDKKYVSLAIWAGVALFFMMIGAIGTNVVPARFFGVPERFSVFAATSFNAVLGVYLFRGIE